ncbi:hypothetical protein LTR37_013269 [Vermiconidia calcicola]|uniref:Uncharacterized protein n=1 Tax=Vermiconidia calcicola TaxID=1690605 RepID=A0ACC3MXY7_9PEZI|nr:hypothetical protein LTR37_013269 [Vermiconidia calcicola]
MSRPTDYIQGQKRIEKISNKQVRFYNNDYVGAGSYNIFAGVFVAFVFGAAFFFDLFWPERKESNGVRIAWKTCGVLAIFIHLAAALAITIITARHTSYAQGLSPERQQSWWDRFTKHNQDPLIYSRNPRALAAVVCILLFLGIDNTEKGPGPKSRHAREKDSMHSEIGDESAPETPEKSLEVPRPAHVQSTPNSETTYPAPAAENPPMTESQR